MTSTRGHRRHNIELPTLGTIPVYAGVKVGNALEEVQEDMSLYKGVRLAQLLEAVYRQGLIDGRAQVFNRFEEQFESAAKDKELNHKNPGRPRKRTT
jgi:hypothetical protein